MNKLRKGPLLKSQANRPTIFYDRKPASAKMKEHFMTEMKFGWRTEESSAALNSPGKDKSDDKARSAPASGKPIAWLDLRNVADGKNESPLRPARGSKA